MLDIVRTSFWRAFGIISAVLVTYLLTNGGYASAQPTLPTLGDTSDLTTSAERRLGDRIIRELYRDPDYVDDPVVADYVRGIWQPLLSAAKSRGELLSLIHI